MKFSLRLIDISNPTFRSGTVARWRESEPFVENTQGQLIHRPRDVTIHKINGGMWPAHLAIGYWCGMSQTGSDKFTFLEKAPEGKFVCKNCELNAVKAGLPTSSELSGRHVCIGGVKAFSICHP